MMNFDGSYKSRPSINLSGTSRQKTRDELIREAAAERRKREREKQELAASIKIQSVYRSYRARKQLKKAYRQEFDTLFSDTGNLIQNLNVLLPLFVKIYDPNVDNERLAKLSHTIVLNKQFVIELLLAAKKPASNGGLLVAKPAPDTSQHFAFTFSRFLVINLKTVNKTAYQVPLRVIDFFTDFKSYGQGQLETASFLFNFLIKNGLIRELSELAVNKIPYMVGRETRVPLADSIVELIYRSFFYLNSDTLNVQFANYNKHIVEALCNQLFVRANLLQIRYCLIELLSKKFYENARKTDSQLEKLNIFTNLFNQLLLTNEIRLQCDEQPGQNKSTTSLKDTQRTTFRNHLLVLFCILKLFYHLIDQFTHQQFKELLKVIQLLINQIQIANKESISDEDGYVDMDQAVSTASMHRTESMKDIEMAENEEPEEARVQTMSTDNDDDDVDYSTLKNTIYDQQQVIESIFKIFNSKEFCDKIESSLRELLNVQTSGSSASLSPGSAAREANPTNEFCLSVSHICHFILVKSNSKIHQSLLLRTMAFNKQFLTHLWRTVCTLSIRPNQSQELYLIQMLASGTCTEIYDNELSKIVAPLSTFCSLYNLFLLPILDKEFLNGEAIFSKSELIKMCAILKDICLGIIRLMHPDTFLSIKNPGEGDSTAPSKLVSSSGLSASTRFKQLHQTSSAPSKSNEEVIFEMKLKAINFTHLFQSCAQLVQRMHTRDIRFGFCPEDHWISNSIGVTATRLSSIFQSQEPSILTRIKFGQLSYLLQDDYEMDYKLSVNDIRSLTVLQELPFTVPFKERVEILESFIILEPNYSSEHTLKIRIRRDYLYEDAFENLSKDNAPNLKSMRVAVEMINQLGLDEAGIDGGGLFREFILQLLETGFDPIRGFFILTSDGFLYPNPNIKCIHENYKDHYYFLGRMLAKAIQCKILSQLKFAGFFLQKILSKSSNFRLDIDYLASLDPQVYRNLLSLKDDSNVSALELTFALDVNEFGENKTVELKPGGKDILVTNDNRIEYIHLLADYKLNRQINEQVMHFRNGMADIIDLELMRLFNFNELQSLISGSVEIIDVDDWKVHTVYSGVYYADHPVIANFWMIVHDFSEDHKRKLLKFATSRSRPPLFGFKNLIPNFAIQNSSGEDRLPSASTCLNLLKLPPIEDYDILREKLICAIESDAGFDLS